MIVVNDDRSAGLEDPLQNQCVRRLGRERRLELHRKELVEFLDAGDHAAREIEGVLVLHHLIDQYRLARSRRTAQSNALGSINEFVCDLDSFIGLSAVNKCEFRDRRAEDALSGEPLRRHGRGLSRLQTRCYAVGGQGGNDRRDVSGKICLQFRVV